MDYCTKNSINNSIKKQRKVIMNSADGFNLLMIRVLKNFQFIYKLLLIKLIIFYKK